MAEREVSQRFDASRWAGNKITLLRGGLQMYNWDNLFVYAQEN
jgi:hypothetical protein